MSTSTHKKASTFLLKTYQILEKSQYQHIVHWNEDQNGFVIADQEEFANKVLPIYFKHNNMHSYIRQLNMYGFSKKRARNQNYYFHALFLKNQPELIAEIPRKTENKAPKHVRDSVVSIENQLPNIDPVESLLQMNYCLLMEQAANLKLILNELPQNDQKEALDKSVHEYLTAHFKLIELSKGKKETNAPTAETLLEKSNECLIK